MTNARNFSLFAVIILWATLIGAIMYSHIVFMPAYLDHLPGSTTLVRGPYPLHDERFWKLFHPLLISALVVSIALHWKTIERRKYLLSAFAIYLVVLIVTFLYFVPELMAFAESDRSKVAAAEWLDRSKRWQYLSWIRGFFMNVGFVLLLISLTKSRVLAASQAPKRSVTKIKRLETAATEN